MNNSISLLLSHLLLTIAATLTTTLAYAGVSLPNGTVNEYVEDMRVKALGGDVVIDRQYFEGRWAINQSWKPAVYSGIPQVTGSCTAYPIIKVREREYTGDGTAWILENRYTIRAQDYFAGSDCQANRIQTLRWQDRSTGQWMEYQRADITQLQYQLVRYGDRNNNTVTLDYNENLSTTPNDIADASTITNLSAGKLKYVRDTNNSNNNVLYTFIYTGEQLTEIQDNPSIIAGNTAAPRSVKYAYGNTTYKGQSYAVINQVTDVLGNITRYGITNGELTQITDAQSTPAQPRIQSYLYTAGRVTKYTDALGHITTYKYDYDKNKQQFYVRIDSPAASNTSTDHLITENWYDKSGLLIRRDLNGKTDYIKSETDTVARSYVQTDAAGRQTIITKDEYNNIIKMQYPDGSLTSATYSSTHGGMLTQTDELGITTKYDYDIRGNLIKTTEALGQPEQRVTEYIVNSQGQITSMTRKGSTVTLPSGPINGSQTVTTPDATWQFQYNALDHITQVTSPEGQVYAYEYNLRGDLLSYTNARMHKTQYEVDAAGQLTKVTSALNHTVSYTYDKVGNLTGYVDEKGKAIQAAYDARNRHILTTSQVGGIYQTQYDALGMPVNEIDEDGRSTQAKFDSLTRISEVIDGLGNKTQFQYPETSSARISQMHSQPSAIKFPTYTEQYQYDEFGQQVQQTLLNPSSSDPASVEGLVNSTKYDKRGLVIEKTDAEGKTNFTSYDALGRVVKFTNSLGHDLKVVWDTQDNIIQIEDYRGKASQFEYDKTSRITKQILPLGQVTSYTYDAEDNVVSIADSVGNVIAYEYDELNRIVKAQVDSSAATPANASPNLIYTYAYDEAGNLTQWSDGIHGSTFTYDDAGWLLSETTNYGNSISLAYSYTYTPAGYKKTFTYPDSTTVTYNYTAHGELDQLTIPGEGSMSVNAFKWVAPQQVTLPGGTTSELSYDGLLSLTGLKVKSPGQQTLLELINQYGKLREVKSSTITDTQNASSSTVNTQYTYDAEQQLIQATRDTGGFFGTSTETFSLDAAGNRIAHSAVSGAWTYNDNNQLTQRGTGSNATSYEYDDNGNLTKRTVGTSGAANTITQFKYDALGRLTEVQDGENASVASYTYDYLDNRLSKTLYSDAQGNTLSSPQTTYYLYSDEGLIAEADSAGNITTQYGWKPDGIWGTDPLFIKTSISTTENGNTTTQTGYAYFHNNQMGTPLRATDKAGQVVWRMDIDSFGAATIPTDNKLTSNLRLAGQYQDAETGLHYNTRRYYDPSIGRYITQDPLGYAGGFNLYNYANGDAINQMDPTGEIVWVPIFIAVVEIVAVIDRIYSVYHALECRDWTELIPYHRVISKVKWIKRMRGVDGPGKPPYPKTPPKTPEPNCPTNSFSADTLVHTQDAQGDATLKAIADIKVGDKVLANSEWKADADSLSYETVNDIYGSHKSQTIVYVTLEDGNTITATEGHPFKTPDGWRDAVLLKKGGKLLLKGEQPATIAQIRTEQKTITVYNLEVANAHTFYVGEEGVLVHNAKYCGSYKESNKGADWARKVFDRITKGKSTSPRSGTRVGHDAKGRPVNMHESSTQDGRPTVEIGNNRNPVAKHRY